MAQLVSKESGTACDFTSPLKLSEINREVVECKVWQLQF